MQSGFARDFIGRCEVLRRALHGGFVMEASVC